MKIELDDALRAAGVPEPERRAAVDALGDELERRDAGLATLAALADLRSDIATEFGAVRTEIAVVKVEVAENFAQVSGRFDTARVDLADFKVEVAQNFAQVSGRFDTARVELADFKLEVAQNFAQVLGRFDTARVELAEFKVEVATSLANFKFDVLRWIALLLAVQVVAVGVLIKLLH